MKDPQETVYTTIALVMVIILSIFCVGYFFVHMLAYIQTDGYKVYEEERLNFLTEALIRQRAKEYCEVLTNECFIDFNDD